MSWDAVIALKVENDKLVWEVRKLEELDNELLGHRLVEIGNVLNSTEHGLYSIKKEEE